MSNKKVVECCMPQASASGPADMPQHGPAWSFNFLGCRMETKKLPQRADACASAGQVLAVLLTQPCMAAAHSRLAWALGRGIGEYLLQQADWALQVPP